MNLSTGYILLRYETGWKKPIQAYFKKKYYGKIETYHFFAEWNSFSEAINWLKKGHNCPIIVDNQICFGI